MSTQKINELLDANGDDFELDAETAIALGHEIEGPLETVEIQADEAERSIKAFAESAASDPEIQGAILKLLEGPYDQQVAFLLAEEWTFVSENSSSAAPPKKCYRRCMTLCEPVCKKVCRKACKRVPGGGFVCDWVCSEVCHRVCKRVCTQICD